VKFDASPENLAEELLGRPLEELDEDEQRALARVASTEIELDPDEAAFRDETFGDRLADRVAAVGGSWSFILFFAFVLLAWMLLNGPLAAGIGHSWDAYPYIFLNLMLSTLAAFQAPVIMMSQNRQARKDRISNRHDYEVNLRTTVEILRLHRKIDRLFNKMGQLHGEVQEVSDKTEAVVNEAAPEPARAPADGSAAVLPRE
jgi:uncharacterized membrane protein